MIALDDAAWAAPWRRLRVGDKLLLSMGLVATAVVAPPWPAAPLVAIAAIVATVGFARIPLRTLVVGFAAPFAFVAIGAASVAIQVGEAPDDVWWRFGPLSMNEVSVANGAQVFGRSVAGTLAMLLLATTTPMVDLLGWLRRRGVPGQLVEIASLIYRLLFVLGDVAVNLHQASVARLGDAPVGKHRWRRRWQTTASQMGTLLVRSWSRAERLGAGLEARGIDGELATLSPVTPASARFVAGAVAALVGIWMVTGFVWLLR